ncbi:N-6 DNA methylase [Clostridium botulinum]|uniref:N-6 DNA methylase n=1 Tax=Clostridium botulinum TaxID=1491 RepID=UPI0004BA18FE|nr:N-6 DNA methylase [Clostridium botulinum]APQ71491.1 N-6 DNA Methylase family protein [Clostridium botulinum]
MTNTLWKLEENVNDWVKSKFYELNLKYGSDFRVESDMSDYLKEALKGRAKTESKTNFGKPDFSLEVYSVPVVIENKLGLKKLKAETKSGIKFDEKSVKNFAVNGALYYATGMIASNKYTEVIAIGIAGDNANNVKLEVYYVYGYGSKSFKLLSNTSTLDFLENKTSFQSFLKDAKLTEDDKHEILIRSQKELQTQAKKLNKLMHNLNITAPQRVLYISGMLLSMQEIFNENGEKIDNGLIPDDLKGSQIETKRDGYIIVNQIRSFIENKGTIPEDKINLMDSSFSEISKDRQRDEKIKNNQIDSIVSTFFKGDEDASANKQIFTFIYYNIFLSIDANAGHLDIMGEMYSEFLKYALGDGKEIGIVLTPPYVTKMMAQILDVNKNSRVMDLATGSAGFLISSMELMIEDAEKQYGKSTTKSLDVIKNIKKHQLLGVELCRNVHFSSNKHDS